MSGTFQCSRIKRSANGTKADRLLRLMKQKTSPSDHLIIWRGRLSTSASNGMRKNSPKYCDTKLGITYCIFAEVCRLALQIKLLLSLEKRKPLMASPAVLPAFHLPLLVLGPLVSVAVFASTYSSNKETNTSWMETEIHNTQWNNTKKPLRTNDNIMVIDISHFCIIYVAPFFPLFRSSVCFSVSFFE